MSNFEKWASRTFGDDFINEETLTYFRMSAAYDAGIEDAKIQRDELLAALKHIEEVGDSASVSIAREAIAKSEKEQA